MSQTKAQLIDNLVQPITGALGSASAPTFSFTSDPNTGIYSPGADQLAISTNGSGRLFVNSSGNIGVATSSPGVKFDVNGDIRANGDIVVSSSTTAYTLGTVSDTSLELGTSANATPRMIFRVGATERARFDSSGRLGLGTSSPSVLLTAAVADNTQAAQFRGATGYLRIRPYVDATNGALIDSTNTAESAYAPLTLYGSTARLFGNNGTGITVDSSGRVGVGTTSPGEMLTVGTSSAGGNLRLNSSSYGNNGMIRFYGTDGNEKMQISTGASQATIYTTSSINLVFEVGGNEKARIDSSGNLCIGATGFINAPKLGVKGNTNLASSQAVIPSSSCGVVISSTSGGSVDNGGALWFDHGDLFSGIAGSRVSTSNWGTDLRFYTHPDSTTNQYTLPERMRITSGGGILFAKTSEGLSISGTEIQGGLLRLTRSAATLGEFNRLTDDGELIGFWQDNVREGSINVSGTTVSYNGAHLSRWSQLPSGQERIEILRGTVLSNIDEMCEWGEEDNEQLNRMKVSDVEGDKNVSGVFQAWDDDDDNYTNDFYCAMTGDFIIRIRAGVTVERGDLLMSAGDGTAKPQADVYVQDKTIAKVTSTTVSCTYPDGSYCVPCVLMAC